MRRDARKAVLLTSVVGCLAWAPLAAAQTADGATIEEVVITAQRRTENLQQTPVAVTALSPEVLEQRNIQTTQDLMRVTPSLQVSTETAGRGGGSATFFLRGMGQEQSVRGTEPAVGIYVDDFYYPSLQGANFSIIDVDSVEVLRGPQGTLFGRNTIGGAIRYTSSRPSFTTSGRVQGTLGSYDRHDATGMLNLALSENAAVRVTAGALRTDGFVKQQGGGKDAGGTATDLVRVQARFAPTKDLDIELSAQHSRSKIDGFTYSLPEVPLPIFPGFNARSTCDYCQPMGGFREFALTKYNNATATVEWDVTEAIKLKSLSSWQEIKSSAASDLDSSPLPIFDIPINSSLTTAYSQEFQLNGKALDDRFNWVSGVYFYKQLQKPDFGRTVIFTRASAPTEDYRHTKSQAAFIDGTFQVTDMVRILGGIRYSEDDKDAVLYSTTGATLATFSDKFKSTTGRVGVQVQWQPTVMTYATISKGFRGGGVNNSNNVYNSYDPETATTYEAGARMDLFGRRLRLNPTVFHTTWNNIQVQSVLPDPTFGVAIVVQNAAKAHSSGLELEAEAAVTDKFRLFGNLAVLDIQYDSVGSAKGITVDSKFQRAPKFTYALGARYQTPVFNGFTFRSTVNWNWQGSQNSTPTDANFIRLPSYGVLNARIELTDPKDRWTLAVFATNLTKELYYVGGTDFNRSDHIGPAHYDLGRPREFGVSLRYGF